MKLYSLPISPFAARVRIALYAKNLSCEIVPPPAEGLRSPQFLALNPMGKLPLLVLDDGTRIPESETILEYLEDAHPTVPLRPADPQARALMRTIVRVTENYVTPPMFRLFTQLNPATRDVTVVTAEIERMQQGLGYLQRFIAPECYACEERLTLADCCVFPSLHLCEIVAPQLGICDVLQGTPRVASYFCKAQSEPTLRRVHDEITAALAQLSSH